MVTYGQSQSFRDPVSADFAVFLDNRQQANHSITTSDADSLSVIRHYLTSFANAAFDVLNLTNSESPLPSNRPRPRRWAGGANQITNLWGPLSPIDPIIIIFRPWEKSSLSQILRSLRQGGRRQFIDAILEQQRALQTRMIVKPSVVHCRIQRKVPLTNN